jgi:outer membrane receptor protein involved in Fe transport
VLVVDYYQTTPGGPLTSGYVYAQHYIDGHVRINRSSFYATDTFRKDRLTLNLGFRFDHQTGENQASSIPGVPGFEHLWRHGISRQRSRHCVQRHLAASV